MSVFSQIDTLIKWLDEDDNLYDVVPSKTVVPPEGIDMLNLGVDMICRASFNGQIYRAKVVDYGM